MVQSVFFAEYLCPKQSPMDDLRNTKLLAQLFPGALSLPDIKQISWADILMNMDLEKGQLSQQALGSILISQRPPLLLGGAFSLNHLISSFV